MMGVPKEGPSAGITIVTGIVSALTGRPVRNDIAMTGEITIMGKVLGHRRRPAEAPGRIDAGCKEVIMPKENERDVQMSPTTFGTGSRFGTSRRLTKCWRRHWWWRGNEGMSYEGKS